MHVNGVEIGAFFPVDLDIDEQLVHHGRDAVIFKTFMGHDMAPVARRIADRQQNRLVLGLGACQRIWPPGVPVHRVMGVLQQIGTGFAGEAVFCHGTLA